MIIRIMVTIKNPIIKIKMMIILMATAQISKALGRVVPMRHSLIWQQVAAPTNLLMYRNITFGNSNQL